MSERKRSAARGATGDDLRGLALALPEAVETITWGEPHFRVHNRIFTGLGTRDGRVVGSVKLEKVHAEVRLLDPRFRPAPYVGRYGWVEFALADVTVAELEALLEESLRLVAKEKSAAPRKRTSSAKLRKASSIPRAFGPAALQLESGSAWAYLVPSEETEMTP